jgi:hypothetical protein
MLLKIGTPLFDRLLFHGFSINGSQRPEGGFCQFQEAISVL